MIFMPVFGLPPIVRRSFLRLAMKLLFDQNLSFKLPPRLNSAFPDSKHVKDFGLTGNDDEAIWQLALEQGFVIVSKDSDFLHRSLLRGHPTKVIQVRIENGSTKHIHQLEASQVAYWGDPVCIGLIKIATKYAKPDIFCRFSVSTQFAMKQQGTIT